MGWVALAAADQPELIQSLSAEPGKLQAMSGTVEAYRKWNSEATEGIRRLTEGVVEAGGLNPRPHRR